MIIDVDRKYLEIKDLQNLIEVKKPNNKDGMLAEKNRMDSRFRSKNNKYRT